VNADEAAASSKEVKYSDIILISADCCRDTGTDHSSEMACPWRTYTALTFF